MVAGTGMAHPPGLVAGAGANVGSAAGGGIHIGPINFGRMVVFAGLGAAAGAVIPPLAVIGGPAGGAVIGALLSMVL